jgi:hypothetical protein
MWQFLRLLAQGLPIFPIADQDGQTPAKAEDCPSYKLLPISGANSVSNRVILRQIAQKAGHGLEAVHVLQN